MLKFAFLACFNAKCRKSFWCWAKVCGIMWWWRDNWCIGASEDTQWLTHKRSVLLSVNSSLLEFIILFRWVRVMYVDKSFAVIRYLSCPARHLDVIILVCCFLFNNCKFTSNLWPAKTITMILSFQILVLVSLISTSVVVWWLWMMYLLFWKICSFNPFTAMTHIHASILHYITTKWPVKG